MKVYLASDHAGYKLKEELIPFLREKGYDVGDYGTYGDESTDYPDWIRPCAKEVARDLDSRAIIIGLSGQGEAIVANRVPGIRAVVYYGDPPTISEYGKERGVELDIIALSRQHNDANILSLAAGFVSLEKAKEVALRWLETSFSGEERHVRRIKKIDL